MSSYQFNSAGLIVRKSDGATIPVDPRNADYQEFLASGGVADPYVAPAMTVAQEYAALVAGGLTISSTGTPAINGTYACDDAAQDVITRLEAYIAKNNAFPGGLSAIQLRLTSGLYASVPSIALFQAIGTAIADFIAKVDQALLTAESGGSWVAPSAVVTIA